MAESFLNRIFKRRNKEESFDAQNIKVNKNPKEEIDYNDFTLMYKDIPVLLIKRNDVELFVKSVENIEKIPVKYNKNPNDEKFISNLGSWMNSRCIPKARTNANVVLKELGISTNIELSYRALGISLNDQYWYKPNKLDIKWDDINPYQNKYSTDLGDVLFDPTINKVNIDVISPDATTHGVDAKRWIQDENNISYLIKTNVHNEQVACNEVLASEICKRLNIRAIEYNLLRQDIKFKTEDNGLVTRNCLFAVSKNFCDENHRFISAHTYKADFINVNEKTFITDVLMNDRFRKDILKMIALDFLIVNDDRHYNNFGFLLDNDGNAILAPIYDSGNSMFYASDIDRIGHQETYSSIASTYKEALELCFIKPEDFDWYNPDTLKDIEIFYKEILSNSNIDSAKQDALCEFLKNRVGELTTLIENIKNNYIDLDELLNDNFNKEENQNSLGYIIKEGKVILTSENAKQDCKHLIETKQIRNVQQYPMYVGMRKANQENER